jgi:hypothetical protein
MTLVAATLIHMAQSEGYVHLNHGNKICQTSHMYIYLKHVTKMEYECFNTLLNFGISL